MKYGEPNCNGFTCLVEQYRAKNKHMEKFPADVMHAERATGGDPNIVNSKDYLPQKRESYADIFGDKSKGRGKGGLSMAAPTCYLLFRLLQLPWVKILVRKLFLPVKQFQLFR